MQVQFELVIGENKFTLIENVENHADFFKKLNFYSSLPKVGPNGETDLVLRHRKAKTSAGKDCDYFSIVSEKAKQEFKFGQQQAVQGGLFPKGWEPLFSSGSDASEEDNVAHNVSGGLGAPQATAAPAQAAKTVGLGTTQNTPTPAPAPAVSTVAAQSAAPASNNPQVQQQAKSVLAKFGI